MKLVNSPKAEYSPEGLPKERRNRRRFLFRLLIVVVGLVGFGLNGFAFSQADVPGIVQQRSSSLHGFVVDDQQRPISNALVFIANEAENTAVTTSDGSFTLEQLPAGTQRLVVVRNKVAQEFYVSLQAHNSTEVGRVDFLAPLVDSE